MARSGTRPRAPGAARHGSGAGLQLIAMQARFSRGDPKRDEEDRERGARMRRRYEMQATVEAVKADDRKEDAAERAANVERQRRDYYYDWHHSRTDNVDEYKCILDLVRVLDCLISQVDELRRRLDAIDRRREEALTLRRWPRSSPVAWRRELGPSAAPAA